MGYHLKEIEKREYGTIGKISEEYEELMDAVEQNDNILIFCELADLLGAIDGYVKNYNLSLEDVYVFAKKTQAAFEEGSRK